MAGVSWLHDEWLCKAGRRFSFDTHCRDDNRVLAAVRAFCQEFEFSIREAAPSDGQAQGIRGSLDTPAAGMCARAAVLEATEVTWVNRRHRRRQQQQQQQQQQLGAGGVEKGQGENDMDDERDQEPVLQVLLRYQEPFVAVECLKAAADLPTGFDTWAALFKKKMLESLKQ